MDNAQNWNGFIKVTSFTDACFIVPVIIYFSNKHISDNVTS
jgi:hypothetical protein